jgi:hypothetical protein
MIERPPDPSLASSHLRLAAASNASIPKVWQTFGGTLIALNAEHAIIGKNVMEARARHDGPIRAVPQICTHFSSGRICLYQKNNPFLAHLEATDKRKTRLWTLLVETLTSISTPDHRHQIHRFS